MSKKNEASVSSLQKLFDEMSSGTELLNSEFKFPPCSGKASSSVSGPELIDMVNRVSEILIQQTESQSYVLIALPNCREFVSTLLACFQADLIAVPLCYTSDEPLLHEVARVTPVYRVLKKHGDVVVVTDEFTLENSDLQSEEELKIVKADAMNLASSNPDGLFARKANDDDVAIALFTSGSSSAPKGIHLTHKNLCCQLKEGAKQWACTQDSKVVSWLSLSHNFGLHFGFLAPFFSGASSTFLHPAQFTQNPLLWFETIQAEGATHIAAPDFAFKLCVESILVDKLSSQMLSTLSCVVSGGETVREKTAESFFNTFSVVGARAETFMAHYGLSETGPIVTQRGGGASVCKVDINALNEGRLEFNNAAAHVAIAECGAISNAVQVRIVDPESRCLCLDDQIGEIWVKSDAITEGYFTDTDESKKAFDAAIQDTGERGFFRTGDLGFVKNNQLYVSGREKETIIVRGKNHYPSALEDSIYSAVSEVTKAVVFGLDDGNVETIIALLEVDLDVSSGDYLHLSGNICQSIVEDHGVAIGDIAFFRKGELKAGIVGKVKRRSFKEAYVHKQLKPLWALALNKKVENSSLSGSSLSQVIKTLQKSVFSPVLGRVLEADTLFTIEGLDSLQCVRLAARIEQAFDVEFPAVLLFKYQTIREVANFLTGEEDVSEKANIANKKGEEDFSSPIAIVSMHCDFPKVGEGVEALWDFILDGGDAIDLIEVKRPELWKAMCNFGGTPKKGLPKWAGLLDDVSSFDAEFFGISRREAECLDPQQRKVLEFIWKLSELAGYDPLSLGGKRIGLFVGAHNTDYADLLAEKPTLMSEYGAYIDSGSHQTMIPNRASRWYNLSGPSEIINTACSSSLVALHRAIQSIQRGDADSAIVIGVNLILSPKVLLSSASAGMLSPDGRCKTLDASANGFVRSEGIAGIMLKPLDKALNDGDNVLGVIKGASVNHDGRTNSLRAPNVNAQKELLMSAYQDAGVDPSSISYVELHGTGTSLGDPIEIQALKEAFTSLNTNLELGSCGIGSVKSNIGHTESAAGMAGLIKILLSLRHNRLPGGLHFQQINPLIELDKSPFYVVDKDRQWRRHNDEQPRCAGLSSFGFGGSNAHIIVEEYVDEGKELPAEDAGKSALILLSAANEESLNAYVEKFHYWLLDDKTPALADIAYTLGVARHPMKQRLGLYVESVTELQEKLSTFLAGKSVDGCFYGSTDNHDNYVIAAEDANSLDDLQLLRSWVDGADIDWKEIYKGEKGCRISLPTYVFAKKHYWVPDTEPVVEVVSPQYIHPLLHANTSSLGQQRFSAKFNGDELFLDHHRVDGKKVLPGAAHMEMARKAVIESMGSDDANCQINLKNITFLRPAIIVDGKLEIHIELALIDENLIHFEIFGDRNKGEVYSKGDAEITTNEVLLSNTLSMLKINNWSESISGQRFYAQLEGTGLDYGESFRTVKEVRSGTTAVQGECVLGELYLDNKVTDVAEYILHPAILDGALQLTMVLLGNQALQFTPMPFIAKEVHILRPISTRASVYVRSSESSGVDETLDKFDIDIFDESGLLCVAIKQFVIRTLKSDKNTTNNSPTEVLRSDTIRDVVLKQEWYSCDLEAHAKSELGKSEESSARGIDKAESDTSVVAIGAIQNCQQLETLYPNIQQLELSISDSIETVVQKLEGIDNKIERIIWSPLLHAGDITNAEMLDAQESGVVLGFRLVKALLAMGYASHSLDMIVLTRQTMMVDGDEAVCPAHASIHGLMGALAKECSHWNVRVIDLQENPESDPLWSSIFALPNCNGEVIAYRNAQWFMSRLVETKTQIPHDNKSALCQQGVYLIVGGAGGIGEVFSEYLINECNAQVIWIGRREEDEIIQAKRNRLAKLGSKPYYLSADACDPEQMARAYKRIKDKFGDINGVVVSTIVLQDRSLARMDEDTFRASLRAKVDVSVQVAKTFVDQSLDFVLFFSSMQSVVKAAGQSNYAAGCLFSDAYAKAWSLLGANVKTINWGYWGHTGVVATEQYQKRMQALGQESIETNEAMSVLESLLTASEEQQLFYMKINDRFDNTNGILPNSLFKHTMNNNDIGAVVLDKVDLSDRSIAEHTLAQSQRNTHEMDALLVEVLASTLNDIGLFDCDIAVEQWKRQQSFPNLYDRWLQHSLQVLADAGYYDMQNGTLKKAVSPITDVWQEWERYLKESRDNEQLRDKVNLLDCTLKSLTAILAGKEKATQIMFPSGSLHLVEGIYRNDVTDYFNDVLGDVLVAYIKQRIQQNSRVKIRILEIGAGTGGTSERLFKHLEPYAEHIEEYCYSDISRVFLQHADETFAPKVGYLKTSQFNIEKSCEQQGMQCGVYDIALATNVLHATTNMHRTITNAHELLRPGGLLLVNEITCGSLFTHMTFGLLEGWWRYEDAERRTGDSPALSSTSWLTLLSEVGFSVGRLPAVSAAELGQQVFVAQVKDIERAYEKSNGEEISQAKNAVKTTSEIETTTDHSNELKENTVAKIKKLIANLAKVSDSEIKIKATLESYGIDSIMIMEMTDELCKGIPDIDSTLLFESQTIETLVDTLIVQNTQSLKRWLNIDVVSGHAFSGEMLAANTGSQYAGDGLIDKTTRKIKDLVAGLVKVDSCEISEDHMLEKYGIDSIVIMEMTDVLAKGIPGIDHTLLFETQTIKALVDTLVKNNREDLLGWVGFDQRSASIGETALSRPERIDIKNQAISKLKDLVASLVKIENHAIDPDVVLEKYGIDSIVIMELTDELKKVLPDIDSTLLFETRTITALVETLMDRHYSGLQGWLGESVTHNVATSLNTPLQDNSSHVGVNSPEESLGTPRKIQESVDSDVAIIGLSGRFPESDNYVEFWENLKEGKNCIAPVPDGRWENSTGDKKYPDWGGFIANVDAFDADFFGIASTDIEQMDPQERLFLEQAYACVEDAGYTPVALSKNKHVGVFVGVMNSFYKKGAKNWSIANRVSYALDLHGPSVAIDSACSSSLTSIHMAIESLQSETCEVAIAGGVNLIVDHEQLTNLANEGMLSAGNKCRSYGENADGFVDSEGCGAVVLKPLSQAVADGDHVYGVIKGSMINAGGRTNGYTVPNPNSQADVVRRAIKRANIHPRTISYVEGHGTGTAMGDAVELAGLNKVFMADTSDKQFCAIGSVKSNIGHNESASGIAALTKVLMQMKHKMLVASLHAEKTNTYIDFSSGAFKVQQKNASWQRPVLNFNGAEEEFPLRAGISSYGAGGANAHIVVEEFHPIEETAVFDSPVAVILSAKNDEALRAKAYQLFAWLDKSNFVEKDLLSLAYTLQVGREGMSHRAAFVVSSIQSLKDKLNAYLQNVVEGGVYSGSVGSDKTIEMIAADEDMVMTIDLWLKKKKFDKLLDLWCKGLDLDWQKLYQLQRPRRISLPTYPFSKSSRFWQVTSSQTVQRDVIVVDTTQKNIPQLQQQVQAKQVYEAPVTDTEKKLCQLWQSLLTHQPIGLQDSFFSLGGNSLLALQMISRVRVQFRVEYPVVELLQSPVLQEMAQKIDELQASGDGSELSVIEVADRSQVIPLGYAQERLWFVHEYMEDQRTSYNITTAVHFQGERFSIDAMCGAFNDLVARHEALRTSFKVLTQGGEPQQVIQEGMVLDIPVLDVSEDEIQGKIDENTHYVFDLVNGPLITVTILRISPEYYVLITNIHHIISDGWSQGVVIEDLQALYEARLRGESAQLPALNIHYGDYAVWQREQNLDAHLSYWKESLDGYEDGLNMPYDYPRTAGRAWRAAMIQYSYPESLARKLATYSQSQQSTLFMTLLASLAVIMGRYTGREDLSIGTTVAGRDQIELESLIGFFINILPIRLDLSGNPSLEQVLQRTRQMVLGGFDHQALPFEHLLNELRMQRDSSQIPLVPVMLRHQNFPMSEIVEWSDGVHVKRTELGGDRTTPSELDWQFFGDGSYLEVSLEYAADLFSEATVRRFIKHHQQVLEQLVSTPQARLLDCAVLTRHESKLFSRFNDTSRMMSRDTSLIDLFEQQVARQPEAIACISVSELGSDERQMRFAEVNARANQLAAQLLAAGVVNEMPVGIFSDRSQELLIGLLAVFKAGGCYVPMDPAYPKDYLEQIIDDVTPGLILCKAEQQAKLPAVPQVHPWLDLDNPEVNAQPGDIDIHQPLAAQQLACVMYTSGSTGKPKGVMVPHHQILNWLHASWERTPFAATDVVLQKTPIAFAVSVKELLSGLLAGAAQVMVADQLVKDAVALKQIIARWQVSRLFLVPSHLASLLDDTRELQSLNCIVTAGEALTQSIRDQVLESLPEVTLWNNYGCTEMNDVSYYEVSATHASVDENAFVPIGYPIHNTQVYVLDEHLRQVPIGVMGELYVDSVGMARGYWQQPGLTAERFIANPYSSRPGARMYKTGDMVRYLADGSLEYLGRQDFEIKVRGHRIDVRQVESALNGHASVAQAVVSSWPPTTQNAQLVAYVVASQGVVDLDQLRTHLSEKLPTYMQPSLYTVLESLPKLPNGKLDRKGLPAPDTSENGEEYVAPRNETEVSLAAIFSEILHIEKVGVRDNFFNLGGHSLLATQLISRVHQELSVDIPLSVLFGNPEVSSLAEYIEMLDGEVEHKAIVSVTSDSSLPLTFAQERMWFLHNFVEGAPYNTPGMALLKGEVNVEALTESFRMVIERHRVLRSNFIDEEQSILQHVGSAERFEMPVIPVESKAQLDEILAVETVRPFDLEKDLLIRAALYKLDETTHYMSVVIHHIVFDGWSSSVLLQEVSKSYSALVKGGQNPLLPMAIQYSDYAHWERELFEGDAFAKKLPYWEQQLKDAEALVLPTTYERPPFQNFDGAIVDFCLDQALVQKIKSLCSETGSTAYMVILAAFSIVLSRYSGQKDICIGSPIANRHHAELHDLIGLFVNTLVMRVRLGESPSFAELLCDIKRTTLDAYEHQDVPFEKIVDHFNIERDTARSPFIQVMFNYQNTPNTDLVLEGLDVTPVMAHNGTAKFEITIDLTETSHGISGFIEYATSLFSEGYIQSLMTHLTVLLESVCKKPNTSIDQLSLLTQAERDLFLDRSIPETLTEDAATVLDLYEQFVHVTPSQVAIGGDVPMCYAELGEKVDRVASYLVSQGVKKDTLVALHVKHSADLLIGALGILKAGGAYVAIDSDTAPDQVYHILFESELEVILTSSDVVDNLPVDEQKVLFIDKVLSGKTPLAVEDKASLPTVSAESLANVSYSVGNSGDVVGVSVSHKALSARLQSHQRLSDLSSEDRFLLKTSGMQEMAVLEMFQWMVCGGELHIINQDWDSVEDLAEQVSKGGITILYLPISSLSDLCLYLSCNESAAEQFRSLRMLFCCGTGVSEDVMRRTKDQLEKSGLQVRLIALYGGKEVSSGLCSYDVSDADTYQKNTEIIGKPHDNANCYVRLENGDLAPVGIPGELYVSADQMASGYYNNAALNQSRFMANPFFEGKVLYRTGDLVRWLSNGALEHIGRVDDNDYLRDRRINLRLIEAYLREVNTVQDAVVTYRADDTGQYKIIAYIVNQRETHQGNTMQVFPAPGDTRKKQLASSIADTLEGKLTDYMLPAAYVFLERLPLAADGSVNKAALPAPEDGVTDNAEYIEPRTPTEKCLAIIWQEILGVAQVGLLDSFFNLGGHSLLAIQLVSGVRRDLKVDLPITQIFESPVLESMAQKIDELQASGDGSELSVIEVADRSQVIPLGYAQERLWFVHEYMEDQRTSYNITTAVHFQGERFSIDAMCGAFNDLVARHEALRTSFKVLTQGGEPQQVIQEGMVLDIPVLDVSEDEIQGKIDENTHYVFDLVNGPLITVTILRISPEYYVLITNIHHIISDGWSQGVVIEDLQALYEARLRGESAQLPALNIHYGDYAVWQREQNLDAHLSYWKESLDGYEDGLNMPYDYPRTAGRAWRAAMIQYSYPESLARKLATYSQSQQSTLFMTLLASLAVIMGRYTGREDLSIGTTVAGRDQIELESLIGFFINILPIRLDLSGNPSLEQVLQRTRQMVLGGFDHQALPFEHLLNELRMQRDSSQIPLVPVMLRHQNFPMSEIVEWSDGVHVKRTELGGDRTTPSELDWQFFGDGSYLEVSLEYAADLFSEATVRRFIKHHQQVLEQLVSTPQARLLDCAVLTRHESKLFSRFNDTSRMMSRDTSLIDLFEQQVARQPEAIACISVSELGSDERQMRFAEVNARANQLAAQLLAAGVVNEMPVGIFSDRSQELLIGLLAVFKAGGCYVPMDPAYPKDYLEQIIDDVTPGLILCKAEQQAKLPAVPQVHPWLDLDNPEVNAQPGDIDIHQPLAAQQLACVMYTSGSTGKPKGVMVPHHQILNWLHASWERTPFAATDVVLQKTPIAFAVSVKELLSGLLAGAAQVMVADQLVKDAVALKQIIARWQVSRLFLVPSHLASLLDDTRELQSLNCIVTAGEALTQSIRDQVLESLPEVTLWNNYGCTEMNDVSYYEVSATHASVDENAFVPIGYPIHNTQVYVLDEHLRQVPIGVMGELYVDSVGMARGYWQQPGLTAERFIANPYSSRPGARMYKTGDMVRYLADGSLEYLGRQDFEIKVRGHRIDVRQVESALNGHASVAQAVVSSWPPTTQNAQLVAYVVASQGVVDLDQLRTHLSEKLPTYMQPSLYTVLESLPKLPNGKLDRKGLPAPDTSENGEEYVAPRNETEVSLAAIFSEILHIEKVGVRDNFFNLGGHSLLATQLISRTRQVFSVELPMRDIFEFPELEQMAVCIEQAQKEGGGYTVADIVPVSRDQMIPLSYLQERLWFVHEHMPEQRTSYNGTIGIRLLGSLSLDALIKAFEALIQRHETLRTIFRNNPKTNQPEQIIKETGKLDVKVFDGDESDVFRMMDELASNIYDLFNGPLILLRILKLDTNEHVLLIGMHHIIYDAWSQYNVMSRDVRALYNEQMTGEKANLPNLPIQYADYAIWQKSNDLSKHLDYWMEELDGYKEGLELPYDGPRTKSRDWHAATYTYDYPEALIKEFDRFIREHQATLFMGLLASFSLLISRYTGRQDICIGTTSGGRNQVELEDLVGFFINILPLRIDLSGDPSIREYMERVKRLVLNGFEHQALPFEHLLNAMQNTRDSSQIPLVPIVLRHQNFPTALSDKWNDELDMEIIERDERSTPNEMDLQFFGDGSSLQVVVEYAEELFSENTISRMIKHHQQVMEFLIATSKQQPEEALEECAD
ncbi:amino acid adenylation domain-containing protein [Endozoicomonas sp. SM1973]|uniref:Amino acid adenylation domain-containing protein n=1 Tax=Spartinivicinus marinus TaxID=2994442 RepID=A0A853IGM9_9GAMM|nr:non-ribosomal peptide synthetase [Spartinivicinus marinus]MCX4030126.1 non-ribosomal peptide synthetase [Spartinivicinus marinus]NYZ69151.1 amino acid adenylation domain-containing protein [Spartinivicinus marinus]